MPIFWEGALNKMGKKPFTMLPCRERRLQLPDLPLQKLLPEFGVRTFATLLRWRDISVTGQGR